MKIAVVDDDRSAFELLKTQISQLLTDRTDVVWFSSGEEFLRCADSRNFDLIILDIFMDRLTGMEVAKEIRKNDGEICIVFCTSSNDFASESYEVGASYYLRKPWDPARLKAMFDRLDLNRLELSRAVRLPDGRKAALCDIISADCSSHFVTLHCKEGGEIRLRASFSEITELLCCHSRFFSPGRGLIINLGEVTAKRNDTFVMSDGQIVPISRRRAREALEAYSSFKFDAMRKDGE